MDLEALPCDRYCHVALAEEIWDRPLVMVTGKGGVGKTTAAAALALAAQQAGRKVLLAEVSPELSARSALFGLFGRAELGEEERIWLRPNLDGVRISPNIGHRLFLRDALKSRVLASGAMRSAALNRFLLAAPAFPEIGTLYQLVSILRQGHYQHVIVDLPATGHALALASLPRTVLRVLPRGLIGAAIKEGLEWMTDPARTGAVIVTLPEDMPVTEAMELREGLEALSIEVRAMLLNRLPRSDFGLEEIDALQEHLRTRGTPGLLGAREFRRLLLAMQAQQSFRARMSGGAFSVEIPQLSGGAMEVVQGVAAAIVGKTPVEVPA